MTLHELDLLLRGIAIGLALMYAAIMAQAPDPRLRLLGPGMAVGVTAFMLLGVVTVADQSGGVVLVLRLLAIAGIYQFYAWARLLFEDRYIPHWSHGLILASMLAAPITRTFLTNVSSQEIEQLLRWAIRLPALALLGHVLWRVMCDWRDDLVERRRRARFVFIVAGTSVSLVAVLSNELGTTSLSSVELRIVQGITFVMAQLFLGALLFEFRYKALLARGNAQLAAIASSKAAANSEISAHAERVTQAMQRDHLYRVTGLTIGAFADRLGMPEYRLRRVINRGLGYRNFNDFLNTWRLREAGERLRDPAQLELPILSIALGLGYGSIGPFNRAFKQAFGITPSEYRRGESPTVVPN